MKPVRLLMTTDAVGGVWTYALDLTAELARRGVHTTLAVLGPAPASDQAGAARAVPGLDLALTGLPLDWAACEPAEVARAGRAVAALAREVRADLVHLNGPALAAQARFDAPVVGVCHSCVATWWASVRGGQMPDDFGWRTDLLARGYRACDALAAPSHAFAEATARAYGIASPAVVHNGRRPAPPRTPAKSERVVFTAGRLWDAGKDVATLDRAAAQVDAPVFAAGPLQSPTGERAALQHARPLGRLDEAAVAYWMGRARVFVSTSLYEPFGLSVLEAAQADCALVLSDIPTFRELWSGAAVFVPPGDDAALAGALNGLLDDPGRCGRLAQAARERSRRYTAQAMGAGMLALYRSLLPAAAEAAA